MSFTDDLKRSLGFESNSSSNKQNKGPSFMDLIRNRMRPNENYNNMQNNSQPKYYQNSGSLNNLSQSGQTPSPIYDDYVIIPESSFYEIVLIRPKTIDDVNYIVDQVREEKNPVIVDLSFLEKESAPNFKLAGDKINHLRERHEVQVLLLSRSEDKNMIIISPKKVKIVNKG